MRECRVMMKKLLVVAMLSGFVFVGGCDDKKKEGGAGTEKAAEKGGDKAGEKGGDKGGGGGGIGVPECDDYLKKMEACLGKMPAEAKAAMEQGFKTNRDAWKQAASSSPAAKEALKPGCKAALDALAANPACK